MRSIIVLSFIIFSMIFISCNGENSNQNTNHSEQSFYQIGNDSSLILALLNKGVIENHKLFALDVLKEFYKNREYQIAWIEKDNINQALKAIEDIYDDGLHPEDYHYSLLKEKAQQFSQSQSIDSVEFAYFDILLSDAIITASMHLMAGKVDPESLKRKWNINRLNFQDRYHTAAKTLQTSIDEKHIVKDFENLKPKHYMYSGLKKALVEYREYKTNGGWDSIASGETLKINQKSIRVSQLKARLLASNEMEEYVSVNDSVYDSILFLHVQKAQKKYGIQADGNVGKQSIEELNISLDYRIEQIKANLERARWVMYNLEDKFIAVNIAAFELYFVDHNKELLTSKVIVGKDHTKTTIFKASMQYVVINPTWGVPRSLYGGYINKLKNKPEYFAQKNMEVITTSGQAVAIEGKDWSAYTLHNFPYMFRQKSGPSNALGYVKCMFPNQYSIYIHDTPSRSLFNRETRTFSHGCIRTEKIRNVAELLLQPNNDGWNQDRISEIIESGTTTTISLKEKVPVLIIYWTAGIGFQKNFYFKPDIYKRDNELIEALNKNFEL